MTQELVFLGDLCLSGVSSPELSDGLQRLLSHAEIVSINFEGPVTEQWMEPEAKAGPALKQSSIALDVFKSWGVTHYSLANNHIMDYGSPALEMTLERIGQNFSMGAGKSPDEAYEPVVAEISNRKIAFLSFSEAQFGVLKGDREIPGYAWVDHPDARQAVIYAREKYNFVIVQVHAGLEMVGLPLPEWRQRYRELVDLGADLVIGHHPHVIQGSESYKGKMIYYSLGNFYMDGMLDQPDSSSGAALFVTIKGNQLETEFLPLKASRSLVELDHTGAGKKEYLALCDRLSNESAYLHEIQEICTDFWLNVYSSYYESALLGLGVRPGCASTFTLFRKIVSFFLRRRTVERNNMLLMVHNIQIETHRWVVERALLKAIEADEE